MYKFNHQSEWLPDALLPVGAPVCAVNLTRDTFYPVPRPLLSICTDST